MNVIQCRLVTVEAEEKNEKEIKKTDRGWDSRMVAIKKIAVLLKVLIPAGGPIQGIGSKFCSDM
jgi:hypothetical protein